MLLVDFWQNQVLDPNNISLYQPDDIILMKALLVIMGDKDFHFLCLIHSKNPKTNPKIHCKQLIETIIRALIPNNI